VPPFLSSRAGRLPELATAAVAVLAAGLLLIGGSAARPMGAAAVSGGRSDARPPAAGAIGARDTAMTARLAGPLAGIPGYLRTRQGVVQVALFDRRTGRTYLFSNGAGPQYTASIVKADIMAMWLWRYQSQPGTVPANIPFSIRYLLTNMITISDNSAATGLFYFGGGCTTLTLFNTLIPTRRTKIGCETPTYYGWGNTTTTAADQVAIVRTFAYPSHVLTPAAREYGLHLMESVIPAQRWGVSCGPWGTACDPPDYATPQPGVTVALKNGWKFVPGCTAQDESCPWQVNSIGWVRGKGRDYALAVLTTDDPVGKGTFGFDYGITTIQGVSQRVWSNLEPPPARGAPHPGSGSG
jgi:hypothetical protein